MNDVVYLVLRYLAYHRWKTLILVASVTLILYVPTGLRVLVQQGRQQLTARAEATPLLIGSRGSPLELTLNSLYASADVPDPMNFAEVERVQGTGLADAIPLHVRFEAQGDPIVGTAIDYFSFRGLDVDEGSLFVRLGDCVVGAAVARRRSLGPGDSVVSSPESAFDLAGVYPLKMRVRGVLAPSGTPDDDMIFVDLKTAWIMEGLAHGHADLTQAGAGVVLQRSENVVVGNAAVVEYNEVTDENIDSFHFHGDPAGYPITAVIAVPKDQKSAALLMSEYQEAGQPLQILEPLAVIEDLLATVLTVESFVVAALVMVGVATLGTATLVFLLSLRLRRGEIETLVKLGGSRLRIAAIMASEVAAVVVIAVVLAGLLTWVTGAFGPALIRRLVAQ